MTTPYTTEQFWKLYEKLPQELKDALFDEETGHVIYTACQRNNILQYHQDIIDLVGQVLIGLLLPQDFQKAIEEIVSEKKIAEQTAREINRFVFYPVKPALEQLHRMEIEVSAKIVTPKPEEGEDTQEKPEEPRGDDSYREPLE